MAAWMRAAPLLAALAYLALSQDSAKLGFTLVGPAVIQQRVNAAPRKLADRKTEIEALFREVGCDGDRLIEQPVRRSQAPNLVCTLAGETDSEIVVGGHFDSIELGMGAVDDWSGVVLLPSLYQSLKNTLRRHRFVFVGFAGEEQGLFGSREFVRQLGREEIRRIRAMINLECLGAGPPEVWARRANPHLLDAYAAVASAVHVEVRGMNVDDLGDDDSHAFLNAGVPVLTMHSLTRETWPILHSKRDTLTAIHPDDYYTTYRLAAAYLVYLDSTLE